MVRAGICAGTDHNINSVPSRWKLRLRPEYLPAPSEFIFPSLPSAVTKVDTIFRDQFAYVIENVRSFFIKAYMNGEKYWRDLATNMDVVLTVPNGWEGRHQQRMRLAAIDAGLVAASEGSRIKFVSEGEVSLRRFRLLKELRLLIHFHCRQLHIIAWILS